jgi:hypothetical protein
MFVKHKKQIGIIAGLLLLVGIVAGPVSAALPDTIFQVDGTHIVVGDCAGDYAGDLGTCTDQISLTGLAAAAARQGVKIDLGANRAQLYSMTVAVEYSAAGTAGQTADFYLGFSPSATAGTANPGGTSGTDAAYTGTGVLATGLRQLQFVGAISRTADTAGVVQFATVGTFRAPQRYVNLVVVNSSTTNFDSDDIEMGVLIVPLTTQIQE